MNYFTVEGIGTSKRFFFFKVNLKIMKRMSLQRSLASVTKAKHVGMSCGSPEPYITTCQKAQADCQWATDHGPLPH